MADVKARRGRIEAGVDGDRARAPARLGAPSVASYTRPRHSSSPYRSISRYYKPADSWRRSALARAAIKGLLVTGIGAVTGAATYGVAYERHQIGVTAGGAACLRPAVRPRRASHRLPHRHPPQRDGAGRRRRRTRCDLLLAQTPDLIVLGGDYVTFGDRAFVEPVAELLAPLQRAARRVCHPRQPRRRPRYAGGAVEARHRGAEGRADAARDPRRAARAGGTPVLDAAAAGCGPRAAERRRYGAPAGARSAAARPKPRRSMYPAVLSGHTHGGQVVLPGVGAVARRASRSRGPGIARRTRRFSSAVASGRSTSRCESIARRRSRIVTLKRPLSRL